jgi:hypothetical protein
VNRGAVNRGAAMKGLKSKPSDPARIQARVEAALAKHDRGEPLTEKDWTIVYWSRYAAGCHACGGSGVGVAVTLPEGAR